MESYFLLEFLVIYYYVEECYSFFQFDIIFGQFADLRFFIYLLFFLNLFI